MILCRLQHLVVAAVPVGAVGRVAVMPKLDVPQAAAIGRQHQRPDRAVDSATQDHLVRSSAGSSGVMSPSLCSGGSASRRISSG